MSGSEPGTSPGLVVETVDQKDRIDYQRAGEARATSTAPTGERVVPYHCPFCAEEDLRPAGSTHGAWHCRSCLRVFSVRFHGIAPLTDSSTPGGTP